jgi:hypothetical protein
VLVCTVSYEYFCVQVAENRQRIICALGAVGHLLVDSAVCLVV